MSLALNPIAQALITWHPSPISALAGRQLIPHTVRDGENLRECMLRAGIDPHALIVVSVDGELIDAEQWDHVSLKIGQVIAAQVAVANGGGGSNPLKIALSIGLMLVAPELGPELGGMMFGTDAVGSFGVGAFGLSAATIGTAVISIAGNALLGAMFSPASNSLSNASGRFSDTASSPTYALTGGSNRMRPYEPLPVIMGRHRIFPDYGAKPYTEYDGEDQYLYQIFNFGLSQATYTDFKIGETSIDEYRDVEFFWSDINGNLPNFPGNVDSAAGASVTYAGGPVVRTSSANAIELAVDIEAQLYSVGDNGVGAESCVMAIEYRPVGGGAWSSFVETEIVSYGSWYWSLGRYVALDEYGGRWQQYSYDAAGASHSEGDAVTMPDGGGEGGTVTYTWRVRPYAEILSNGDGSPLMEPAPPQPRTVTYAPTTTLANATSKPLRKTFRVAVAAGQYEVRVSKVSGDSSSDRHRRDINWSVLRTYQTDTASYLGQTRLGVKIRASGQLNGTLQAMSAEASAVCLGWDADASAWVLTAQRNPAWWFLDFAVGRYASNGKRLYGCGQTLGNIDIEAIKAWGAFCDAEGLTLDVIIDRPQSCADVLNLIARCGLGSPTWGTGKLGVVWDAKSLPVSAVFSMANIIRGSFSVEYTTERLADEIIVTYFSRDKGWQQDQVRVLAPGVTTPERPTTIELMGCTEGPMAGKFANVVAAQQFYRRRRVTWESDFEGFVVQRGDVVLLSHDLTQWGYSGRPVSATGSQITLDRSVPRNGLTEHVGLIQPNGTLTIYDVVAGVDGAEDSVLTLATPPSWQAGELLIDHRWVFSPMATPGKKVKIVSVQPVSDSRVRIVATDEDPQFYAAWDGTYESVPASTLLRDKTPVISSVTLSESLARAGNQIINRLNLSWVVSGGFERAKVRWRIDAGPWTWVPDVVGTTATAIDIPDLGMVDVEITPINGTLSGSVYAAQLQVYGKTLPPGDVPWFSISNDVLSWGAVPDVDLAGYAIRWQPGDSRSWGDAQPLNNGLITASPYSMSWRPSGPVTLLIKAVDTSGNESTNPSAIVTDLGDPLVANVIVTYDYHAAGFIGEKTGGTVEAGSGDLIADADASAKMWANDLANMWSVDETMLMWAGTTYGEMTYIDSYTVAAADAGAQLTLANAIAAGSFTIDYRRSGTANMWTSEPAPMWSDDAALMWASEEWRPWPGAVAAEPITYEWRVRTAAGATRGRISALAAQLDVPDIVEYFDDASIASGGTRLALTNTYRAIKNVSLTLQDDGGAARTVKTMDKNASLGPLIQCFNSAGSGTTGKIDAVLQGF